MKTKREVLEGLAKHGHCEACSTCPYNEDSFTCKFIDEVKKLGAKEMLKTLPRDLDRTKVLTCVTADQAKVGMKGYFADSLQMIEALYDSKIDIWELAEVRNYRWSSRFVTKMNNSYSLFYPIEEDEE